MEPHVDAIVRAYLDGAEGDPERALREAVTDALADLVEADRKMRRVERLVSKGYARGILASGPGTGPDGRPPAPRWDSA